MKKRLISMITAGGAAVAALAVTAGPAQAAYQPPPCQADTGACLAVTNAPESQVRSIKLIDKCVTLKTNSVNSWYSDVAVAPSGASPTTLTYTGDHCENNTQNSQPVVWSTSPDGNQYRWVVIGRIWR